MERGVLRFLGSYLNPINSKGDNKYISLGTTSGYGIGATPLAFEHFTIPLDLDLVVNEDNIKNDEAIEGKATFSIKYI